MISLAFKPADAMVRPAAVSIGADHGDLVRQRRVGQRDGDAVIVRTHVKRVLVRERNVDARARRGALGERGNPRLAAAGRIAHDISENGRQHRNAMLLLAVDSDDRALAVAFGLVRGKQRHRQLAHMAADLLARLGERAQVFFEFSGERIIDDGNDRDLAQWRVHGLPGFDRDVVNERKRALDLHRPSSPAPFYCCANDWSV